MKDPVKQIIMLALSFLSLTACTSFMTDSTNFTELPENQIEHFSLDQPWYDQQESNFRKGNVTFQWSESSLLIHATLRDEDVYTESDADNQPMWELGDVFEVFLQIEGQEDYVELHITPANTRFHAHKPNVPGTDKNGEWKPIEHWLISPVGFNAKATQTETGWNASLEIPPQVLELDAFTPGMKLRIAFARYDGAKNGDPVLSASAPHKRTEQVSFHIPEDWHRISLQD